MRRLALLLALLLAPQAALAGVAAFPETALRVDREISGRRAGASARQVAEGRLEKGYFYGESASAIVDDPINHRDPTGEAGQPGEHIAGIFTGLEMSDEVTSGLVNAELYRCKYILKIPESACTGDYLSGLALGTGVKHVTWADLQNVAADQTELARKLLVGAGFTSAAGLVPIVARSRSAEWAAWRDMLASVLEEERKPAPMSLASPEASGPVEKLMSGVPGEDFVPSPSVTTAYVRPSQAGPTKAQKQFVQGKPCVDCGAVTPAQVADHIEPLSVEYYRTGKIDVPHQSSTGAVQSHCPSCSNKQGGQLSAFARRMKKLLKL